MTLLFWASEIGGLSKKVGSYSEVWERRGDWWSCVLRGEWKAIRNKWEVSKVGSTLL